MNSPRVGITGKTMLYMARLVALVVIVAMLAISIPHTSAQDSDSAGQGPQPGAMGEPERPIETQRVYDVANILDSAQESSLEADAARLARNGVPSVVIVLSGDLGPEEAEEFAANVRRQWGVESALGAEDGLLLLAVVDPTNDESSFSVMSWGEQALPHFGIDEARSTQIQSEWLDAYLSEGHIFEAILYTLRRLIYHAIYAPAPQEPLTDAQTTMQTVVDWTAPLIALAGLLIAGMRWVRESASRRPIFSFIAAVGLPIAAALLAIASVWSRSEIGVVNSLVLIAAVCAYWIMRDPGTTPSARQSRHVQEGAPS